MKNFNLLRKSERKSVGTTLALTVGSPSFDRRGTMLKHYAFMLLFLLGSLNVWGEDEVDVLKASDLAATSSTYTNFSNVSKTSAAVYAGQSAKDGSGNIQLRSKNSNSGIVSTTSGGVVKSVKITVGSGSNTIDVYGSNSAYTAATDLYGDNKGTKVGSLSATGTITFEDEYAYVGIRSNNGALYLSSVEITWTSSEPSTYTITAESNNTTYGTVSLNGSVITGSPKPGYRYADPAYSISPNNSATVSQLGDAFTVTPSENTTVTINFEAIPEHNIIFNTNGVASIPNAVVKEGASYDITETPAAGLSSNCEYGTFVGWTTATSIANPSVKPELVNSVTMSTADVNLNAVYGKTEGGSGASVGTTLFSENFTGASGAPSSPTTGATTNGQTITYVCTDGTSNTKIYDDDLAGGASPEILVGKSSGSFAVSNISTGGATSLTLTYQTNNTNITLSTSSNVSAGDISYNSTTKVATATITVSSGSAFDLTFVGGSGNSRLDNISIVVAEGGGTTTYSLDPGCAAPGQCYAPTFSPAAGTFDVAQNVELASATDGATIRYTIDGSTPSKTVGTVYSSAIAVSANTTITAIAYKDGMTDSEISTGVFNIRCAQPTFSLVESEYTTAQNVTISADGADHIYYTINGDDPSVDPANLYDGSAIAINTTGSHTIKAIAVKAGYANSNVASATYVMDLPYGSIAEFVTAKPNTAKDLVFEEADNCVITGINGTTIYIQDASGKGIMIFGLSSLPTNAAVNHQITGTINAKYTSFKGQHEMTNVDFSGASISEDPVSRPTPAAVTAIDATKFNEHTMVLVSIENLYYKSSSDKTHKFATTEGGSTEYTIYDQFGIMSGKTMPETSVACNLTGILSVYNTTYQLLPVFATDIVADADAAAPTVSPAGGADAENAVTAAAVEITAAAGTKVDGLASKTVDINSVIPTEVTVEVIRDFYRPVNYSCGWYKAAAAKYNINGQGATTEGTVVAKVAGVEAATAAEGDEVHVFITPNAHFHLATIKVNGNDPTKVTAGEEYSFTMPGEAVTIAVTWTEDAKYALTFTAGEGSGDAPAISGNEYYAGEVIQLPANTFTYDAQHKFTKWLIGGTEYAAGANYTMPAAPAEAVAQWKTIPAFASGDWILVKDAAELSEGSYVIIASANAKVAMKSYASGNNCKGKGDAEKSGDLLTYDSDYGVFEIGDYEISEVTYKTFFDVETEQYLFLGTDNNYLKAQNAKDANAAWTITSVSSEGVAVVTSKSYNTRKMRYNSNSTLFACYTGGQGDIVFYKYHVPSLKLSYDANAGGDAVTNLPGMQIADGENKVTVSSETPLRENYIFNGWKDGESNDHAAGDVITLSENMTLYAQWREPNTYSISYDANGGTLIEGESEITPTSVTEGNAYTIEENVYEVEGKLFIGWKANGVTYNAGQEIYPTEDMAFVAQWGDPNVTDFMLVTDVKQLKDGDKVYIVAADYNVAMGTQHGTDYRNYVEIAKQNNRVVILNATPVEFTVGKVDDNFTFYDGTGYLYASSSDKNYLNTKDVLDDNGKWAITINAEGVASIIAQGTNENNNLKWNNSSPRFSCYASGQKAVSIYKRPDYTRNVSGNYATICLPKAGQIIGATLYEIAYYGGASKKIFFDEIVNGEMEAGIPYIFQPAAGVEKINVYYSDNTAENVGAGNRNGLIGFYNLNDPAARHDIDQDAGYYILYNNQYWLVSGRAAYVENYRAYIRLADITPSEPTLAPGRRRISMSVNDTQTTTGFENAEANEAPRKVLINGELFILRGEKMYDAKGQLVK